MKTTTGVVKTVTKFHESYRFTLSGLHFYLYPVLTDFPAANEIEKHD